MRARCIAKTQVLVSIFFFLHFSGIGVSLSHSAAKKPTVDPNSQTACFIYSSTPNPVRPVVLGKVGTQAFQLPNGFSADLSMDLQSMLNTVVSSTSSLMPTDAASGSLQPEPCDTQIYLRSAVTYFKLDAVQLGISVGFTPSGPLSGITGITGKTRFNIGTLTMDFSLWKCTRGVCSSVAASSASHATLGGDLSLEIDLSVIKTGPSLMWQTPLGGMIRKIMQKGISELAQSERLRELPWRALVKEYNPATGSLIFNAGLQSRIFPNQTFEVYAPLDTYSANACDVYRVVAYAHTTTVNAVSSTALVDQIFDSRGVKEGDILMIRAGAPK